MKQALIQRRALLAAACSTPLISGCFYDQFFDIEWDEEVLLHDGRVIWVHVKRTFERFSRFDRWRALDRDTSISLDTGQNRKINRVFQNYDVNLIEERAGLWYVGLAVTTGIPPKKLVNPAFGVLIIGKDDSDQAANSWAEIPNFPQQNVMPVTPNIQTVSQFANSQLSWKTKMTHWQTNPRAAGDTGRIIQRHKSTN